MESRSRMNNKAFGDVSMIGKSKKKHKVAHNFKILRFAGTESLYTGENILTIRI